MRLESGPFRPHPDDWQGYFLRGDEALGIASALKTIATTVPNPILSRYLTKLSAKLYECYETNKPSVAKEQQ